ncbi:basigin isoform X2 [Sitodiplosis mosellana]|nr:basigin isoform X2 [Sitodiplosis mosellana]
MEFYKHFKLNSMLQYITVILFIASTTVKSELTPNYSDKEKKVVFFEARDNTALFLSCKPSSTAEKINIKWEKNGTDISEIPSLKGRYNIKENNLIIPDTTVDDDGKYTCRNTNNGESADIEVIANVYLKNIPDNWSVVEGEKLEIHCKAFGTNPEITWLIGNDANFNRSHVTLKDDEDNVKDAILIIKHAVLEDRNWYNCTARNQATGFQYKPGHQYTEDKEGTYVRVKGKLAALWPFLGICAEVFILCAIILVYEKRRNKEGLDESDTDQSPEQ